MTQAPLNFPNNRQLLWIPADLPRYAGSDLLVEHYEDEYIPNTAQRFASQRLTVNQPHYGTAHWRDDLQATHGDFFNYINDNLPFKDLITVKIHRSRGAGAWHRDFVNPRANPGLYQHNQRLEPSGYRMVIRGENSGSLRVKVQEGQEYRDVEPVMPPDTQWYILGHTSAWHSQVGYLPDRYVLFCHAWLDEAQHREILQRSLEKYSDYAVWSD